jgi:hypothetical protein
LLTWSAVVVFDVVLAVEVCVIFIFIAGVMFIAIVARPVVALAELEQEEMRLVPVDPQTPSSLFATDLIVKKAGGEAASRAKVRSSQSLYNALIVDARLHADLLRVLIRATAATLFECTGAGIGTFLLPGTGTGLFMVMGNLAAWLAI